MILLIDNYDSFSYNLYQMVGKIDPDIRVIRNDEMTPEEIRKLSPKRIIISPGPGRPEDAGNIIEVIKELGKDIPILGVCLGHQAICTAFWGRVGYAREMMHGKQSEVEILKECRLFEGLPDKIKVARYHSLAVIEETVPPELEIVARSDDGEIMALMHKKHEIYGVQFHPESILTPDGEKILKNFMS